MTLYVFPDPRVDVAARLNAGKTAHWPTATISTSFPSASITVPHIQHDWDGTPVQQANRQGAVIRVTCWTPKVGGLKVAEGIALAQLVLAYLLATGSTVTWRFTRGAGPLHGIDPDTGLPFCSFTVTAETVPTAVS